MRYTKGINKKVDALTYWWRKYQNIKCILEKYMRDNKVRNVEDAIKQLLNK